MLSDLALIDWIALVFAAVLLAAAAAAAIVAYATAKNRPAKASHRPAHAVSTTPPPPSGEAVVMSSVRASAPVVDIPAPSVAARAPQPEFAGATSESGHGGRHTLLVEPSSAEESVAARAAKLRGRPVPDNNAGRKQRIVSAVEPKRMPAHAPNRAFAHAGASDVAIEMGTPPQGFAARTPGFFEDPVGRHELRYWDGHRWTEYVKEHGERFTDPL